MRRQFVATCKCSVGLRSAAATCNPPPMKRVKPSLTLVVPETSAAQQTPPAAAGATVQLPAERKKKIIILWQKEEGDMTSQGPSSSLSLPCHGLRENAAATQIEAITRYTMRLYKTRGRPNLLRTTLFTALDKAFGEKAASMALSQLVREKVLEQRELKIASRTFEWYYVARPFPLNDLRLLVKNELRIPIAFAKDNVVRRGGGVELQDIPTASVVRVDTGKLGLYHDVLDPKVLRVVQRVRPQYAHELCDLLVEMGVLPSPHQLRRLYRQLSFTTKVVKVKGRVKFLRRLQMHKN